MNKKSRARRLKDEAFKRDRVARELFKSDEDATANTRLPVPSTNPATNLVIADIILRGASSLFRESVEKRVAEASYGDEGRAREVLEGRTILTSIALYGASKLATRSRAGLALVTGGLVLKALYDRGKSLEHEKRKHAQPVSHDEVE